MDPLVTVAQAAHVREGPEAVRRVLVGIHRAQKLSTRKAARQAALPVPVASAVLRELGKLGLKSLPSMGNFLTIDLQREAAPVYEALLREGVIVRPVANYGMPAHLRVTVGTAEQNTRFIQALSGVLA